MSNPSGTLYVVATPIGNLGDMSPRAVQVLTDVDTIAAEDTRHTGRLLAHFGVRRPLLSLHEHNETQRVSRLLGLLEQGRSIALVSDAGTPLVNDPGYRIVRACHARSIRVVPVPGPCAAITALSAAGLPTDAFVFEGFLPAKRSARRRFLHARRQERRTLVFYESPRRLTEALEDLVELMGPGREATLARELTKKFETLRWGTLADLLEQVRGDESWRRGELVLLVHGREAGGEPALDEAVTAMLETLLGELPLNQAVRLGAALTGMNKNTLYAEALRLKSGKQAD